MENAFRKAKSLYDILEDDQSKQIFLARLMVDFERSPENFQKLASYYVSPPYGHRFLLSISDLDILHELDATVQTIIQLNESDKKVVIYGTAVWGRQLAIRLYEIGSDFYSFVDRNYELYQDGLYQKKVYSPQWLIENKNDVYVIVAAANAFGSYDSIECFLTSNGFPSERIISTLDGLNHAVKYSGYSSQQYFDFMELYQKGTAFIDCGGYDGNTSIQFAKNCNNEYSKIIMFEPDAGNAIICRQAQKAHCLHDFELIQAGCSDEDGEILFESGLQGMSHFAYSNNENKHTEKIETLRIDSVASDIKVGFIKMDIEGAEMRALEGARETIRRDKPLLALCVYHKPGDTLEFMDYLRELVPEYRFWLRHYAEDASETVLYAAI